MKREPVDFFIVADHHLAIHARLENWARYVESRPGNAKPHPMWAQARSNSRQWHQPEPRIYVNMLDGHAMEKAVYLLPEKNRDAIRWAYVYRWVYPKRIRQALGVTDDGLMRLIADGRSMLNNRRV